MRICNTLVRESACSVGKQAIECGIIDKIVDFYLDTPIYALDYRSDDSLQVDKTEKHTNF